MILDLLIPGLPEPADYTPITHKRRPLLWQRDCTTDPSPAQQCVPLECAQVFRVEMPGRLTESVPSGILQLQTAGNSID